MKDINTFRESLKIGDTVLFGKKLVKGEILKVYPIQKVRSVNPKTFEPLEDWRESFSVLVMTNGKRETWPYDGIKTRR